MSEDCQHNNREYVDGEDGWVTVKCITCGAELGTYRKA